MNRLMTALATTIAGATAAGLLTAPAQASEPRPPSRPGSAFFFGSAADDQVRLGWTDPARTGSHPIRRYVLTWVGGRLVVPASVNEAVVTGLEPGRYTFAVRAVSRAGSSRPAITEVVFVK